VQARLCLGTALRRQFIPGQESPDILRIANQAIEAYEAVLKLDPKNTTALANIAQLYYGQGQFDKAKPYELRRIEVDPTNPEPYFLVGMLDEAICLPRRNQMRKELGRDFPRDLKNPNVLPPLPEKARARLASETGAAAEEGIQHLKKAIELKPDDANAMAYLNLLYRQKADLEASDDARREDLRIADEWVNKALEKHRAQNPQAAQEKNPPAVSATLTVEETRGHWGQALCP
jgi:tetratricopeptide (TPR) repeat protein